MIRVSPAPEPARFQETVTIPGLRAVAEMVGEKPSRSAGRRFKKIALTREDIPPEKYPPFWTECLPDLMEAYGRVCAYSCFRIHEVTGAPTVDHFAPKSRNWDKVYQWSNYRLACLRLNARKRDFSDVLDPFEISNDWFRLELVGFQVIADQTLSEAIRQRVDNTIDLLGLNDFRRQRMEDAESYWIKDISLKTLSRESPFVAKELRRHGRLNLDDV